MTSTNEIPVNEQVTIEAGEQDVEGHVLGDAGGRPLRPIIAGGCIPPRFPFPQPYRVPPFPYPSPRFPGDSRPTRM